MSSSARFSQLSDWLAWLETLHPKSIDLGVSRVFQVASRLDLFKSIGGSTDSWVNNSAHSSALINNESGTLAVDSGTVFTVAGTNGKGSCVATIEQCLLAQGLSVGSYTSPHFHHYCERIRINGEPVSEALVCDAFAAIDYARQDISLSYFEFGTLAALWIFVQKQIPFVLLEVGLGGRLDAVNIVDADIAIVTSIAVDHEEWLGSDREVIAEEKLGVSRPAKPVIITECDPTQSIEKFVREHGLAQLIGRDFHVEVCGQDHWLWQPKTDQAMIQLPLPQLPLPSVAAGLQALHRMNVLPEAEALADIIIRLQLMGRYQSVVYRGRELIFDVAHNPAAASALAEKLRAVPFQGKTLAVFTCMNDKDIPAIVEPLCGLINEWYVGDLPDNERAVSTADLRSLLERYEQVCVDFKVIEQAADGALTCSQEHDRIVIFGSFFTVAEVQHYLDL